MPKRTRSEYAASEREEAATSKDPKEPAPESSKSESGDDDQNLAVFQLPFKRDKQIRCETRECTTSSSHSIIFTHGAGGGLETASMRSFAKGFSRHGRITSFQGNLNLTSRIGMFRTVVSHQQQEHKDDPLVLGGRSMGARAAVLTALELVSEGTDVDALVLVSYPLTASKNGKQEREFERREKILLDLPESVDVLFMCGTKDVQCDFEALREVREEMKGRSWFVEVRDADHGMNVVPKAGTWPCGEMLGEVAARWLERRDQEKRISEVSWNQEDETAICGEWQSGEAVTGEKRRKKE